MITSDPHIENILNRLQVIEEKIKYAEKLYKLALTEGKPDHEVKRLKQRVNNLKKERSLFHAPMQKLKPIAGYHSYLYNKIESLSQFNSSRYL